MPNDLLIIRRYVAAILTLAALMTIIPVMSEAGTVFFTDERSFNAANPGLPVENFASANLLGQPEILESSPLSSTTNNATFASGSILPGITISNLNPLNTPGLIVYAGGPGNGAHSVGDNYFGDPLVLSFAPGVTAVGTSVFANTSPGPSLAGDFTEQVFNGATLLGSTTFSETAGAIGFIGVSSSSPITSVQLLYTTDDATTFVSDIAFGSASSVSSSAPEPANLALSSLAVFFLALVSLFRSSLRRM